MKASDLMRELSERQRQLDLDDEAFARLLGVHRTMWSSARAGNRKPGAKMLTGIARQFPDLRPACRAYYRQRNPNAVALAR